MAGQQAGAQAGESAGTQAGAQGGAVVVEVPSGPVRNESTPELCSNGRDDDGDGFIDCSDLHCQANPATGCEGAGEASDEACSDGVDNDDNGFSDCEDFNCNQNPFVTVCGERENTYERCTDGLDNDQNNFVDCDDTACERNLLVGACKDSERGYCLDDIDNDQDGLTDCDDPDCGEAAHCVEARPTAPPLRHAHPRLPAPARHAWARHLEPAPLAHRPRALSACRDRELSLSVSAITA